MSPTVGRALVFSLTLTAGVVGLRCSDDPAPTAAGSGGSSGANGGGAAGVGGGTPSPPLPAYVAEYAALRLKIKLARCEARYRYERRNVDCRFEASPMSLAETDALVTGRSVLRPENGAACVAAFEGAATIDAIFLAEKLCGDEPLAVGTVENGQPCGMFSHGELSVCKDGYCAGALPYAGGVCKPKLKKGESCNETDDRPPHSPCGDGLSCRSECRSLPLAIGATCDPQDLANARCAFHAHCDEETNRCVATGGTGAACTTADECRASCGPGKVCEPRPAGGPCNESDDCVAGLRCLRASEQASPTCTAADATRCDPVGEAARCAPGQYCLPAGTCAPRPTAGVGAPCVDGLCATGLMCSTGLCVNPAVAGVSCRDTPCFVGTCVAGTCTGASEEGQTCGGDDGCNAVNGLACRGQCRRVKRLGETCGSEDACDTYTFCAVDQTCQPKRRTGETCSASGECWGQCTDGKCATSFGGA